MISQNDSLFLKKKIIFINITKYCAFALTLAIFGDKERETVYQREKFLLACDQAHNIIATEAMLRTEMLMQDERGLFYYPDPTNHSSRVYVRRADNGEIEFRLWQEGIPEVWERHPWLPHDVLKDAAALYQKERNKDARQMRLYDLNVAKALLKDE